MKDYTGEFIGRFGELQKLEVIKNTSEPLIHINESNMANIFYYFILSLSPEDKIALNETLNGTFSRLKNRKKIEFNMYLFVKQLRQADVLSNDYLDMTLWHILNSTTFLEKFIFFINNEPNNETNILSNQRKYRW